MDNLIFMEGNLSTHIGRVGPLPGFIFHLTETTKNRRMNIQQTGNDSSMNAKIAQNHQIRSAGIQSYIAQLVHGEAIAVHNSPHTPGGTSHAPLKQQFTPVFTSISFANSYLREATPRARTINAY